MKLSWSGTIGSVERDGMRVPVHVKPFLPFQFDRLEFDADTGEANFTHKGRMRDLNDQQIQQCVDWIIDAFDGGVAGT